MDIQLIIAQLIGLVSVLVGNTLTDTDSQPGIGQPQAAVQAVTEPNAERITTKFNKFWQTSGGRITSKISRYSSSFTMA